VTQALNAPAATGDWRQGPGGSPQRATPDKHEADLQSYHGVVDAMRRIREGMQARLREERAKEWNQNRSSW
jgi:hypothetical protein